MTYKTFKTLALVGATAISLGLMSYQANAANTANVTFDIDTLSGITATTGSTMDFGTWLIGIHTGDTPTITMATDGTFSAVGTPGTSQVKNLTGATSGTAGTVTVTLPAGADGLTLQMTRTAVTDFADAGLTLEDSLITYSNGDALGAAQNGTFLSGPTNNVPISITTGATGAVVSFGGTITASATPSDATHTASFDVTFAY